MYKSLQCLSSDFAAPAPQAGQVQHDRRICSVGANHPAIQQFIETGISAMGKVCTLCFGSGHNMDTCGTRHLLDGMAKDLGISWEWGASKGAAYYADYLSNAANQPQIQAKKASALRKTISKVKRSTYKKRYY